MIRVLALLALLSGCAAVAVPLSVTPQSVGPPGSGAPHVLVLPDGAGPHPAVVLLHGCSGVTGTLRRWSVTLARHGYAVLMTDSFRPRGETNVCHRRGVVPPELRAEDAFAAATYLRGRGDIRPGAVAAMGLSHGGSTALEAALRAATDRLAAPPFAAVIAFYPWCKLVPAPLASPLLILTGSDDDWTPSDRCERRQAAWQPAFGESVLHVYPGATHAFDGLGAERRYLGHLLRHDAAATRDAEARLLAFLARALPR